MRPGVAGLFDLTGRVAVVTGARRGVGLAAAEALAMAGADIIGVSAGLESEGSDVQQRVSAAGRQFTPVCADLSDRTSVHELLRELRSLGPIDILVNDGGASAHEAGAERPPETWHHRIEVELTSQFVLSREVGAGMVRRGHGKVILTASPLSRQAGPAVPSYAVTTSGVAGLTRALAHEWAAHGVNVNAIAPGYIATEQTPATREDGGRRRPVDPRILAGRWGRAEDLGGATVFLSAPASDYVHGVVLPVDGGWLGR
ncbi:SDR family oxidoreductase [Jiangella rhizosphaerae]|uniref:SDR family oxidoreductase n=1 Tax=Jiangella rhizosphaerae TaxID=2293569 RepID=A0A418KM00_9ACTN|nr:SDR family oxidoreductase [Jiangella rhizosphaerae]RIQ18974.1 SDR family oxidoreductase [Jiangella rhizosphaerae]